MHIAALVKQVVSTDDMDAHGRRAVAQAVELAAAVGDGLCTVINVGATSGDGVVREAIAWGSACSVMTDGVTVTDRAFADADPVTIGRALAATVAKEGPYDLVLVGARSSDLGSGFTGPVIAEVLDLPFLGPARFLSMQGHVLHVRTEREHGFRQSTVGLPAVISCGLDLIEPCEMPHGVRATVPADLIHALTAGDLGTASRAPSARAKVSAHDAPDETRGAPSEPLPSARTSTRLPILVVADPDEAPIVREMLGAASDVARAVNGHVVVMTPDDPDVATLGSWGADTAVALRGARVEEDVARGVAEWCEVAKPWAVLGPATYWGREVLGRTAVRLGASPIANAIELTVADARLVARTRTDEGATATMTSSSGIHVVTVRDGAFVPPEPRSVDAALETAVVRPRGRVRVVSRRARS